MTVNDTTGRDDEARQQPQDRDEAAERGAGPVPDPASQQPPAGQPGAERDETPVRVRVMQQLETPRYDGRAWPAVGEEFEVPAWEAAEITRADSHQSVPLAARVREDEEGGGPQIDTGGGPGTETWTVPPSGGDAPLTGAGPAGGPGPLTAPEASAAASAGVHGPGPDPLTPGTGGPHDADPHDARPAQPAHDPATGQPAVQDQPAVNDQDQPAVQDQDQPAVQDQPARTAAARKTRPARQQAPVPGTSPDTAPQKVTQEQPASPAVPLAAQRQQAAE